ncbi:DUF2529 family protein [Bacillus lacus]|uniref:DUF2529 family protein n=1 Tax=Metabacillus lacus TaxID=1983721 RepID=A0A7X2IX57_9BACI|nr:DUF2529 domain-containing protein [Metabacillus lacus]MRX71097.1 DUF2529 family protein [Metabacillus lacus]
MLKIFTTQLAGQLQSIQGNEEYSIEDGARLLAQAAVSQGTIYIHGFKELQGVYLQASQSDEKLVAAKPLFQEDGRMADLTSADRVLLFTHLSTDSEAIELAGELAAKGASVVGVSALVKSEEPGLSSAVDIHIDSKLKKPLIPDEDGTRFGFPALITSLYVYFALSFALKEMLAEYMD